MPGKSETFASAGGTRFRLFAQPSFLRNFREPETVVVSSPAGSVGAGPSDERMYVIDPIGMRVPYGLAEDWFGNAAYLLPPWPGAVHPPAWPDPDGHFDHIAPDEPEFEAAHLFGSVRFTLDVWEKYFGHPIEWHFSDDFDRLELVIQGNLLENAFMGYGFLEVGVHLADDGVMPFSLNFDVIAHEVGHCLVYSMVGVPDPRFVNAEYYGFHESAADLTALIAALHFETVIDELLDATGGNLYARSVLTRIAELTDNRQIRLAANPLTLADFAQGWRDEHDLAQPLTGAMFDILVDVYHEELVFRGLISAESEDLSDRFEGDPDYHLVMQPIFDAAFEASPGEIREALLFARDMVGTLLAETWRRLSPEGLGYDDVGRVLLAVDRGLTGGRYQRIIRVNLDRRAIGRAHVGPRLTGRSANSHVDLPRVFMPERHERCCGSRRLAYREKFEAQLFDQF